MDAPIDEHYLSYRSLIEKLHSISFDQTLIDQGKYISYESRTYVFKELLPWVFFLNGAGRPTSFNWSCGWVMGIGTEQSRYIDLSLVMEGDEFRRASDMTKDKVIFNINLLQTNSS